MLASDVQLASGDITAAKRERRIRGHVRVLAAAIVFSVGECDGVRMIIPFSS
jgi:hypothetical protein